MDKMEFSVNRIYPAVAKDAKIITTIALPWLFFGSFGRCLVEIFTGPGPESPNFVPTAGLNLIERMAAHINFGDPIGISPLSLFGLVIFFLSLVGFVVDIQRHWTGRNGAYGKTDVVLCITMTASIAIFCAIVVGYFYVHSSVASNITQHQFMSHIVDNSQEAIADPGQVESEFRAINSLSSRLMFLFIFLYSFTIFRLLYILPALSNRNPTPLKTGWRLGRRRTFFTLFRLVFLCLPFSILTFVSRMLIEIFKRDMPSYSGSILWSILYTLSWIAMLTVISLFYERLYQTSLAEPSSQQAPPATAE